MVRLHGEWRKACRGLIRQTAAFLDNWILILESSDAQTKSDYGLFLPDGLLLPFGSCSLPSPRESSPSAHLMPSGFQAFRRESWLGEPLSNTGGPHGAVLMLGYPSYKLFLHVQPVNGCSCVRPNFGPSSSGQVWAPMPSSVQLRLWD